MGLATLTLLVSIVLSLFAAEFLLRLIEPQEVDAQLNIYQSDPDLLFKFQPNVRGSMVSREFNVEFVTNSDGFRDREYPIPKPPDTCHIIIVGDSFSVGYGVGLVNVYGEVLEQKLNEEIFDKSCSRWEVINASVPGYAPYMYLETIRRYASKLEVDMVIVGFFIGNDFLEISEKTRVNIEGGYLLGMEITRSNIAAVANQSQGFRRFYRSLKIFVASNSHLYVLLRKVAAKYHWKSGFGKQKLSLRSFLSDSASDKYDLVEGYIKNIKNTVDSDCTALLFFIIPQQIQVKEDIWAAAVSGSGLAPEKVAYDRPNRELIRILDMHNIQYIDMLPVLHDRQGEEFYFPRDGHWNMAAHIAGAESLNEYIQGQDATHSKSDKVPGEKECAQRVLK